MDSSLVLPQDYAYQTRHKSTHSRLPEPLITNPNHKPYPRSLCALLEDTQAAHTLSSTTFTQQHTTLAEAHTALELSLLPLTEGLASVKDVQTGRGIVLNSMVTEIAGLTAAMEASGISLGAVTEGVARLGEVKTAFEEFKVGQGLRSGLFFWRGAGRRQRKRDPEVNPYKQVLLMRLARGEAMVLLVSNIAAGCNAKNLILPKRSCCIYLPRCLPSLSGHSHSHLAKAHS